MKKLYAGQEPLLKVQVTQIKGGTILAVTVAHMVAGKLLFAKIQQYWLFILLCVMNPLFHRCLFFHQFSQRLGHVSEELSARNTCTNWS